MAGSLAVFAVPRSHEVDAMFRLMVEEIDETAIFLMDASGIITVWNKAATLMIGYTAEEAVGAHFGMLYTDEAHLVGEPARNLERAERDGSYQAEDWRKRKNGALFWARITLTALRGEANDLLGFGKVTLDLTRHKLLEQCEKDKEEVNRVLEATSAGTWLWNPADDDLRVSSHLSSLLGYPDQTRPLRLHHWLELVHPAERDAVARMFRPRDSEHDEASALEARVRSASGQYRWIFIRASWLGARDAPAFWLSGVAVDIDELKAAQADVQLSEQAREMEEQRAATTLRAITDGVITTDSEGRVDRMNPAAERLTGWASGEALGHHVREVYHVLPHPRTGGSGSGNFQADPVSACLRENKAVASDNSATLVNKQGQRFAVRHSAAPLMAIGEKPDGAVLIVHDNTESKGLLDQLAYQASHDALTGLINRREFNIRLERSLAAARREPKPTSALLFLDLDHFKIVNDSCGHLAGDELLQQLSAAYAAHLRERDTLARIGGDEFALIVERCSLAEALAVAGKLLDTTRNFRYSCSEGEFSVGVSIGVVTIDEHVASIEDAMRMADHACYVAKESGRNRIHAQPAGDLATEPRRDMEDGCVI